MKKKTIVIIVSSILFVAIVVILLVLFVFKKNTIESINIKDDEIKIYLNKTYDLKYEIKPEKAKNQPVTISIEDNSIASIKNNIITGEAIGETNLCITSKNDKSIKDCVNIIVASKKADFISNLEMLGYKKTSDTEYTKKQQDITYTFNFDGPSYTTSIKSSDVKIEYVYNYRNDNVTGYATSGGLRAEYYYSNATKTLSCAGKTVLANRYLCDENSKSTTKNSIDIHISLAKSLFTNFSIDDIYN